MSGFYPAANFCSLRGPASLTRLLIRITMAPTGGRDGAICNRKVPEDHPPIDQFIGQPGARCHHVQRAQSAPAEKCNEAEPAIG